LQNVVNNKFSVSMGSADASTVRERTLGLVSTFDYIPGKVFQRQFHDQDNSLREN